MHELTIDGLVALEREEAAAILGGEDSWGHDVGYVLGAIVGGVIAFLKDPPQASYAYAKVGYPS
jgi:hypothetical protein